VLPPKTARQGTRNQVLCLKISDEQRGMAVFGATQERGRFCRDPAAALRSTRHWLATKAPSLAAAQIVLTGPKKKPGIARL